MWLLIHPKRGGTISSQLGRVGGQLTDGERGKGNRERGGNVSESGDRATVERGRGNRERGKGKREKGTGRGGTEKPGYRETETMKWRSERGENVKRRSTDDTPLRPYGSRVFSHASMLRSKLAGYVATMSPVGDT